ncbi:MAG: hypothetical protein A2655_03670 [Candidatus Yanofskybacteria bacterium RIFCSPHIGHO2_01_FULL_43_42]|uniref:CMP/dCMP-type deaminase domain-containing protein n=1 Tax=Candidatus Yanofskybacteria bacterium RIFCSPLOWO2_01_FULL_43_22 TaxID=1802695 RepID=A0A1F8GH03_9BACT|nr:MAG: hypothetical protein A2655_03670 [Candidatus Yanofskybacteria bacterium RIFCSPHIGHO2_01_FULL_43_42]OGN12923.1 MAG: hypothetical protein A3D48_03355 [Candidatus Yanofskybacteria bacterium RIFCSPHIGHO2_02_FULL_43_17]OGN23998.1 MAG: hypothetical protein A3A13_02910 [Candidatus Yanofskybacteria bacterium RIFCSPLOWO2_01_FULL_43_22]
MAEIKYPYLPEGKTIKYVAGTNPCMIIAREIAQRYSLDRIMPGGAIIVRDGRILGRGANGSDHHEKHGCERVRLKCKTGEGYELCEGCHPKNHSEPRAINNAKDRGNDTRGADLYLWGHWWCCRWCWEAMIEAGIKNVYLMEQSEVLFNKDHPDNIVGRQFA